MRMRGIAGTRRYCYRWVGEEEDDDRSMAKVSTSWNPVNSEVDS